jgi:anti-sigma factor RsiW
VTEMACSEIVETITAYLEGTLGPVDRARFDAHLAECPYCTDYLAQMRTTIERLGRLDETMLSSSARAQLVAAFRDWRDR